MYEGLTHEQLRHLVQTAVDAAHLAAVPIRAYFERQDDLCIREKSDGSPVTQADREGEVLIRSHLLSHASMGPLDILGEEEGLQGTGTRWRWTVDPIDGTRSFIHGIPLFGTIIALLDTQEKFPVVGVIHLPMLAITYAAAKGQGATCQQKTLQLPESLPIENAIIGVGDFAQFSSARREADYRQLLTMSSYVRGYTDCFGHGLVISGALGAMVDPALNPWDILATQVLIEEAGGLAILRPSSVAGKIDALFGNRSLVQHLARVLSF
jgi:fructose-1,6-bisphosphatase/inositol monophosphatase family enzyme